MPHLSPFYFTPIYTTISGFTSTFITRRKVYILRSVLRSSPVSTEVKRSNNVKDKAIDAAKKATEKFAVNKSGVMKEFFAEVAEVAAEAVIGVYMQENQENAAILAALQQCRDELLSIHMRYGDLKNAEEHSIAIRNANILLGKLRGQHMINISKRQWRRVRGKLIAKNKQMRRIKSVMFIPRFMQSLYIAFYI